MKPLKPIHYKQFEKFLQAIGCKFVKEQGEHLIYKRSDLKSPVILPMDPEIPVSVIMNILSKISKEEFLNTISQFK